MIDTTTTFPVADEVAGTFKALHPIDRAAVVTTVAPRRYEQSGSIFLYKFNVRSTETGSMKAEFSAP